MIEKNEYRATHEEKNGIVRELRNLEEKYRQEFEEAKQQMSNTVLKNLLAQGSVRARIKEYERAKKAAEVAKEQLRRAGLSENYSHDYNVDSDAVVKQVRLLKAQYEARCEKLSLTRGRIQLATFRSEVAKLNDEARKI
jgi:uncharacterized membrane protein YheB (UPF0754 family)